MERENFIEFNQYEKRAICYELYTENEKFNPNEEGVTVKVYNRNNIVDEKTALLFDNKMCVLIDGKVSDNPGEYDVIWKIEKTDSTLQETEIFYKKTRLVIKKL